MCKIIGLVVLTAAIGADPDSAGQDALLREIQKFGGQVRFKDRQIVGPERPSTQRSSTPQPVECVVFRSKKMGFSGFDEPSDFLKIPDQLLRRLERFSDLRELGFQNARPAEGFRTLKRLRQLRTLDLFSCHTDDAQVKVDGK
jgi:hypothetical protein